MPTVALQVTISDYAKWRPIFDTYRSARALAGFKNERVFRNVDDPTEVIIWGEAKRGQVAQSISKSRTQSCDERSWRR